MNLFKYVFLVVMVVIIGISCGSNNASQSQDKPLGKKEGEGKTKRPGNSDRAMMEMDKIPVEITPVVRGDISNYLLYNSTVETEQTVDIFSRIPGLVEKIYVEEGNRVKKDQPLLQLEQDEYVLEEENAKLQYEKQKSEFKRFQILKEKNLISEEEFENARLALRQAELQWKQTQLNLDYTIVRSPINGVVGERFVRLGDRIQTSARLFVISNLDDKVVKLYVPQDELLNCYNDQPATIMSDVLPDQQFTGWVKRISPIVDPTSGTFKVTVGINDPKGLLRPGMFVSVKLIVDTHRGVPLIPKAALVYENERTYFFLVKADSAVRLELRRGFEDAHRVEVLNAIPDSARIVVVGQGGLKSGNKIKVIKVRTYDWQKPYLKPSKKPLATSPSQKPPRRRRE